MGLVDVRRIQLNHDRPSLRPAEFVPETRHQGGEGRWAALPDAVYQIQGCVRRRADLGRPGQAGGVGHVATGQRKSPPLYGSLSPDVY